jgi:hypothetical protein
MYTLKIGEHKTELAAQDLISAYAEADKYLKDSLDRDICCVKQDADIVDENDALVAVREWRNIAFDVIKNNPGYCGAEKAVLCFDKQGHHAPWLRWDNPNYFDGEKYVNGK